MSGTLIFGGTFEARILCERISAAGKTASVCVATPYANARLSALPGITLHCGRLDAAKMEGFIRTGEFDLVLDATHPYAAEAGENIRKACAGAGLRLVRVLRAEEDAAGAVRFDTLAAVVEYLEKRPGRVLVTTGSKELAALRALADYQERLVVRVLPMPEVIESCIALGFAASRIIAMQGPFSHELNLALLRQFDCKFLLTKNSGAPGGLADKVSAAAQAGAEVLLLERPVRESGLSLEETLCELGLGDLGQGGA